MYQRVFFCHPLSLIGVKLVNHCASSFVQCSFYANYKFNYKYSMGFLCRFESARKPKHYAVTFWQTFGCAVIGEIYRFYVDYSITESLQRFGRSDSPLNGCSRLFKRGMILRLLCC